ncbi:uncharacterized protein [Temnothorax longispinosus]|uniref:uncharacterized protein n=1 Tax=Temnothorax longispinosus TaxID=300112 RepID=UPI003A99856B
MNTEEGPTFVFSYSVMKVENAVRSPVTERNIVIDSDRTLHHYVYGRAVATKENNLSEILDDIRLLPQYLKSFQNRNLCNGLGAINVLFLPSDNVFRDYVNRWRHKDCTMITKRKRCDHCIKMRQQIIQKEARSKNIKTVKRVLRASNPIDNKKLIALQKKMSCEKRAKNRAKRRIQLLTQSLKEKASEIASIRAKTLDEKCSKLNISAAQRTALKEIISAASKRDTKNRRYSEEWTMLCMMMNIRSPSYYEFLRKNNILPLPCIRTVRSYWSLIDIKCGFDEQFQRLLKKHFEDKTPLERHGILLLDEIHLRNSLAVCSRNLTYVGLTDFGQEKPQSTDIQDQATHGLVLMFQSLASSYTQPIAVFASKNPVKGEELAKLVLKAITYLENSGAMIHGVIADGAATNAKMWSLLGVSGTMDCTKTWFTHPIDDNRKIFAFSDIPHVIKNIRNRLYNKRQLRVSFK